MKVDKLQRKLKKLNISRIRKNLIQTETEASIQSERQNKSKKFQNLKLRSTPEPSCKSQLPPRPATPTFSNAMVVNVFPLGINRNVSINNDGLSPSLFPLSNRQLSAFYPTHLSLDPADVTDFEDNDDDNPDNKEKEELEEKSFAFAE